MLQQYIIWFKKKRNEKKRNRKIIVGRMLWSIKLYLYFSGGHALLVGVPGLAKHYK
jgi:hypothetical protein